MNERILILDGAMGSLIQCACENHVGAGLPPDIYVKENPEMIKNIHKEYLQAGADIIETNSFNSNSHSLCDYGLEGESYTLAKTAARIAKEAADEFTILTPDKPRFVAGSVGPTKCMLTLSEDTDGSSFDRMAESFNSQIRGLLDGGADIILFETVFDTLTLKAGLYALAKIRHERNEKIPVIISATVDSATGRLLAGQTIEAFMASVAHVEPLCIGLNCGFGSGQVYPFIKRLSKMVDTGIILYPNAGLPDDCGEYHEDSLTFSSNLESCLKERMVNIVGGCCGTTPAHIRALAETAIKYRPRVIHPKKKRLELSNLEYSLPGDSRELIQVGERTNVAGSAKFSRLIKEKNFDEALEIAARQIRAGAGVVDICMDDGLEDSTANMVKFLRMLNSDSETGAVPVMIDSSDWNTIVTALKTNQGKGIVNSISLKDGEKEFLRRAREIRDLGASVVVMLFDEKGQADTFERKIEVADRAYKLLTDNNFPAEDIIFDPNVLTIGTGLGATDRLGLDFILATKWIKENLPHVSVSGGISNLSFAFRGNNKLREAMHTVFLYHAGKAGLDMAIVNAGMLSLYEDIDQNLLKLLEDAILCRKDKAVESLVDYAQEMMDEGNQKNEIESGCLTLTVEEKIVSALKKGRDKEIENLLSEALQKYSPMDIINEILMPAMKHIGDLFGEGKMFLPQIIKSAQVMKKGVEKLKPFINSDTEMSNEAGKVVIATVKGDVHDIGKNIVGLVVSCNGFEIQDLGVRVDEKEIADWAEKEKPMAVLLSGLISPSLNEMVNVCSELERRGLGIPVIIGGAATSEIHTAIKIAPVYSGPVFYSPDASSTLRILTNISEDYIRLNSERQGELRIKFKNARKNEEKIEEKEVLLSPSVATKKTQDVPSSLIRIVERNLDIEKIEKFIDWNWLLHSLEISKTSGTAEETGKEVMKEAETLFKDIKKNGKLKVEVVAEIFEAKRDGDDIVVITKDGKERRLPMLRGETGKGKGQSVADFLSKSRDYIALFAVSAGEGLENLVKEYESKGAIFSSFLVKLIADRLAEASAQWLSHYLIHDIWQLPENREGVRIAFGYPSAPDHTLKRDVFEILNVEKESHMRLTENAMICPGESVCGMIFSKGDYINIGKVGDVQLKNYAARRNMSFEEIKKLLPNNIRE